MASCEILLQQLLFSALVLAAVAYISSHLEQARAITFIHLFTSHVTTLFCVEAFIQLPDGNLRGGDAEVLNISLDGKLLDGNLRGGGGIAGRQGSYFLSESVLPGNCSWVQSRSCIGCFLIQASANTILSHFLGLVFSLELLRSVTLPPSESIPVPRLA